MSDQQQNQQQDDDKKFFEHTDAFIELANKLESSNQGAPQLVGASLMFAAARYNAFLVARTHEEKSGFEAKKEEAIAYFSEQFTKMLTDNWADYGHYFDQYRNNQQ